MRLTLYRNGKNIDVTQLSSGLTWSGDKQRATRSLQVSLITAKLPDGVDMGDWMELTDDNGGSLFYGLVVQVKATSGSPTAQVTAYDRGVYLVNNDGTYNFRNTTPEAAAAQICREYSIPYTAIAETGVRISRKFAAVSLWQIMATMYAKAGEQNGKQYMIRFVGKDLRITERTERDTNLVIRPGSNLIQAETTKSIINLRDSVAVFDSDGNRLQVVNDDALVSLYGLMQKHITVQKGEDQATQAKAVLDQSVPETLINVQALGDTKIVTGETVIVSNSDTGLQGLFWVESDTHTWSNGLHQMRLSLLAKNIGYTANAGSDLS